MSKFGTLWVEELGTLLHWQLAVESMQPVLPAPWQEHPEFGTFGTQTVCWVQGHCAIWPSWVRESFHFPLKEIFLKQHCEVWKLELMTSWESCFLGHMWLYLRAPEYIQVSSDVHVVLCLFPWRRMSVSLPLSLKEVNYLFWYYYWINSTFKLYWLSSEVGVTHFCSGKGSCRVLPFMLVVIVNFLFGFGFPYVFERTFIDMFSFGLWKGLKLLFFHFFKFCWKLIYKVVIISAVQHSISVIHVHTSILFISFPP